MSNPPWKPAACACGTTHPCFSLTGPQGPWRCHACHQLAIAAAIAAPLPAARTPVPPVEPRQQGALL